MPADRTRRATTSREAAEAAFKEATTKPAELQRLLQRREGGLARAMAGRNVLHFEGVIERQHGKNAFGLKSGEVAACDTFQARSP